MHVYTVIDNMHLDKERRKDPNYNRTYHSWYDMIRRCTKPNAHNYGNYGAKGISVCDRWMDFTKFVEDMGMAAEGMTIDRINPSGNYEPQNCKWATMSEQQQNKTTSILYTLNGETKTLRRWSTHFGLKPQTVWLRYQQSSNPDFLFRPSQQKNPRKKRAEASQPHFSNLQT